MAARRAVPVRRRRSLTGIDSRDAAGGERGVPLYTPYDPRTPPCLVWWRASLPHVVYLVRRSPQGANRRASSRFAGDMRACCGAPALRGSPPRPGSLGWWFFPDYALTGGEFCSLHGNFPLRVGSFQTGRAFFFCRCLRLRPGIRAWSPARRFCSLGILKVFMGAVGKAVLLYRRGTGGRRGGLRVASYFILPGKARWGKGWGLGGGGTPFRASEGGSPSPENHPALRHSTQ